jgi:hypothetical protein
VRITRSRQPPRRTVMVRAEQVRARGRPHRWWRGFVAATVTIAAPRTTPSGLKPTPPVRSGR